MLATDGDDHYEKIADNRIGDSADDFKTATKQPKGLAECAERIDDDADDDDNNNDNA